MSGIPGGTNLGGAHGTVIIDAQVDAAQAQLNVFVNNVTNQFNQLNSASQTTNNSFTSLSSSFRQMAGAFGISLSFAGITQLGKAAIAASELATAYDRQRVAAESLANGQDNLNSLLAAYEQASGGAVSKAEELNNVTRDISLGFADNAAKLTEFATAARGISLAGFAGGTQSGAEAQLQTAIISQRKQSLRELGVEYDAVKARQAQLQAADTSLTAEMSYGEAVVQIANEKFGDLTRSAEGQATALEKLSKTWSDLTLEIGENSKGAVNSFAQTTIDQLTHVRQMTEGTANDFKDLQLIYAKSGFGNTVLARGTSNILTGDLVGDFARKVDKNLTDWLDKQANKLPDLLPSAANRSGGASFTPFTQEAPLPDANLEKAKLDFYQKNQEIDQQANDAILAATNQYETQRTSVIAQYEQSIAREAQDFAIQRQREERDSSQAIAAIHAETARQEVNQATQLGEQISNARADSADRLAGLQETHDREISQQREDAASRLSDEQNTRDESIVTKRADADKALVKLEDDYNTQRERSIRDHNEAVADASLNNDAKALFLENRRFVDQQGDAQKAHDKEINQQKTSLDDSIAQINTNYQKRADAEAKALDKQIGRENEAYDRQVKDEGKALDKRISQAQTAYDKQIADLKTSDDKRTQDLKDALTQRQSDEDADRALHLTRMSTDHDAQVALLDAQQVDRLTQITDQQKKQKDKLDEKFLDQLKDFSAYSSALKDHFTALQLLADASFDDYWSHVITTQGGTAPTATPGGHEGDLLNERSVLRGSEVGKDPNSQEYASIELAISKINDALAKLGYVETSSVASASSVSWAMPLSGGSIPFASSVSGGFVGGGGMSQSIKLGDINIYAVPTDTANTLLKMVREEVLNAVKIGARG